MYGYLDLTLHQQMWELPKDSKQTIFKVPVVEALPTAFFLRSKVSAFVSHFLKSNAFFFPQFCLACQLSFSALPLFAD